MTQMIPILSRASRLAMSLAAAALVAACGKSTTGPGGGNAANFTATIDGAAWAGTTLSTSATGSAGGFFTVVGANAQGTALSLVLYNIGAPGTYPLGVGGSVFGGTGTISQGASSWWTSLTGASGTVVITAVSATRIAGTFSFTAIPFAGGAAGNRAVTNGSFDLAVTASGSIAVPPNAGNRFGGTLGGQPWNAATVVMVSGPSSGILGMGFSNNTHQINLFLSAFTGAGTYGMNTGVARYFSVNLTGTTTTWGGTGTINSGAVIVTGASASRLVGTYDVTLAPGITSPGAGTLRLMGAFDVGIP